MSELPTVAANDVHAAVQDPSQFDSVDPRSGRVPGFVAGNVTGSDNQIGIAIALNGTIGAATSSFADATHPHQFAGIMPDFLFKKGKNTVTVYEIVDHNGTKALRPLSG